MAKRRVVVLMGGMSSEHEVSLASGRKIVESLNSEKNEAVPVVISKEGAWRFPDGAEVDIYEAVGRLKALRTDCVFLGLHGAVGEDGRIQGMLDLLGLPYTSSGCAASALAIDKIRSKAVVRGAGIRVSPDIAVDRAEWESGSEGITARVAAEIGFPCVIKSPCQGSSVGLAIPRNAGEFGPAIVEVFAYGDLVMVEQYVAGTEVTCGVLDLDPRGKPVALPVTEIRPRTSSFFDYYAKYTPGASDEITPAKISPELTAQVQAIALRAHEAVGCAIWSRNDMIIDAHGPVWIEINTIPGMTPTSLYPQAAAAAGISYPDLLDRLIDAAIAGRQAR